MRVYQYQPLVAGDMSGNLSSSSWQLTSSWGCAISCVVTNQSSIAGTLTMLGSVDGTNFTALKISGSDMTLTVTGNGTYIFDVEQTSCQYLKVTYTASAGSGSLTVTTLSKGI